MPNCLKCSKPRYVRGLCISHYHQLLRQLDRPRLPCSEPNCDAPKVARNLCEKHYRRLLKYGRLEKIRTARGLGHVKKATGYRIIQGRGEHRILIEEIIGRQLLSHEIIHHKNGNRADNRLPNLELRTGIHPRGQAVEDMLAWCRWYIRTYAPVARKLSNAIATDQLSFPIGP